MAKFVKSYRSSEDSANIDAIRPFPTYVDASPYGLGAAIMHEIDGVNQTLNSGEKNYAQLDKGATYYKQLEYIFSF